MLNRTILIGRTTSEGELKYTPSGVAVYSVSIAVDRPYAKNGKKETDFIPIVTWRQLAEACANNLKKGRLVAAEGRIQTRNYENNEGRRIYVTEVVADNVRFLDSNRDSGSNSNANTTSQDPFSNDGKPIDINDDDLPF